MLGLAIFGATWGASIAFVAIALGLAWRVLGILDFGLAGVYAISGYALYATTRQLGVPLPLAIPIALATGVVAQLLIYRLVYAHFLRSKQALATVVLLGLAVLYVCQNSITLAFGSSGQVVLMTAPPAIRLGGMSIVVVDLAIVLTLIATLVVLHLILAKTALGLSMRGMSVNPELARVFGVSPERVRMVTFAVTGFLASLPAVLGSIYEPITPTMGFSPILFAFAAFVIASVRMGLGILQYAVCGVALGVATGLSLVLIPSQWQLAVPFAAMIVVTLLRRRPAFAPRTV